MKRYLLPLLCLGLLLAGGCHLVKPEQAPGTALLSALFTSNPEGRWDTLQAAGQEGAAEAGDGYLAPFAELCTEDGLACLTANRIPTRLDEMAAMHGCVLTPKKIRLSDPDEGGQAPFTVTAQAAREGKVLGSFTLNGTLGLRTVEDRALVDSIWVEDWSGLYTWAEPALFPSLDELAACVLDVDGNEFERLPLSDRICYASYNAEWRYFQFTLVEQEGRRYCVRNQSEKVGFTTQDGTEVAQYATYTPAPVSFAFSPFPMENMDGYKPVLFSSAYLYIKA